MDADFSIELGRDDPALDFPWADPDGRVAYYDLKRNPNNLALVVETQELSELADLLRSVNSAASIFESAKCDAWSTSELTAEDEIFGAALKSVSYVDLVFTDPEQRTSFAQHEHFAKRLVELLRRAPEIPAIIEICVRRCFFTENSDTIDGYYFTVYVSGYGDDQTRARQNWGIALKLTGNAMLQLSATGLV